MPTVLYIEDNRDNRMLVRRILMASDYDFQVVEADNARTGIEMATQSPPDIILMDMGLPVMNGWQATHRIKSTSSTQAIPIIALTAFALSSDREKCLNVGCDDYETKPVDFARLNAKIQALLANVAAAGVSALPLA